MKRLFITGAIALILTGCGGGGGSSPEQVQQVTPPTTPVVVEPTAQEVLDDVLKQLDYQDYQYARFDIVGEGMMIVYRATEHKTISYGVTDFTAEAAVLVDFTDYNNITITDLGIGTVARGTRVADFDGDGADDYYAYSHGHEFGDSEYHAKDGENIVYLSTLQYQGKVVGNGYTHGACVGDFNGDTYTDILDVNVYNGTPLVRYNDGNGNFTPHDVPVELLETKQSYTACMSTDTNFDYIGDFVLGRNGDSEGFVNGHAIVYGGVNGLDYAYTTDVPEYGYPVRGAFPSTLAMYQVSDKHVISIASDYYTNFADLLELTDQGLVLVETITLRSTAHDYELLDGNVVEVNAHPDNISSYYTAEVSHVKVVDGKLTETFETR